MRIAALLLLLSLVLAVSLGVLAAETCDRCGKIGDACDPDAKNSSTICPADTICAPLTNSTEYVCIAKRLMVVSQSSSSVARTNHRQGENCKEYSLYYSSVCYDPMLRPLCVDFGGNLTCQAANFLSPGESCEVRSPLMPFTARCAQSKPCRRPVENIYLEDVH